MNQRILIFGLPGSGKSSFALELSSCLKIPVYHLDRYFFIHNWVERDYQEFLYIQKQIVDKETWIIDGNAIKSLDLRFSRADLAVYFHFSRYICLWRMVKRLFCKNIRIEDRAEGCIETLSWKLVRYMWRFDKRIKPILEELKQKYPSVKVLVLHSDTDVKKTLKSQSV